MTELKESLPRSGHVTEVCKEWLVREDGALAYRLQNQEISEFYNGNRFRNAVVREDFPTALNEQIKEKEDAAKVAEQYRQQLMEQERADAELARNIAEKIDRDRERDRQKELSESESMAKLLQRVYIEKAQVKNDEFSVPNMLPPKSQIHYQHGDVANIRSTKDVNLHEPLSVSHFRTPSGSSSSHSPSLIENHPISCSSAYKPLPPVPPPARNIHPPKRIPPHIPTTGNPSSSNFSPPIDHQSIAIEHSFSHHADIADSIRHYNLNDGMPTTAAQSSVDRHKNNLRSHQLQLSPEKYDFLMRNLELDNFEAILQAERSSHARRICADNVAASPMNEARSNRPLTVLTSIKNVAPLKEMGMPPEEVLELDKRLEQERRDEELAVRLQKEAARESLTQEERDRLLAIEAQDKELAKMLQERERAKARRAKEKARLKKLQTRPQSDYEGHSQRSPHDFQSGHPANVYMDGDSYSNPIDLLGNDHHHNSIQNYRHVKMASSISADHADEIYTLPVEDDRKTDSRPTMLSLQDNSAMQHSVREGQSPDCTGNIAAVIDPTYNNTISSQQSYPGSPVGYTVNTAAPPYMPIQGTRRTASLDKKSKKSKDKCSHQ